jgi:hypothetical protein
MPLIGAVCERARPTYTKEAACSGAGADPSLCGEFGFAPPRLKVNGDAARSSVAGAGSSLREH